MSLVTQFNQEYGRDAPALIGSLAVTPTAFFQTSYGRGWKEAMGRFIEQNADVRINRGKLVAHILELATEVRRGEHEGRSLDAIIAARTRVSDFELKRGDIGYTEEEVNSVGLSALKLIGIIFLNIITLGIASIVWLAFMKSRVQTLSGETLELKQFEAYQASKLGTSSLAKDRLFHIFREGARLAERESTLQRDLQTLVEQHRLRSNVDTAQDAINQVIAEREALESDIANLLGADSPSDDVDMPLEPISLTGSGVKSKPAGYVEPLYKKREDDDINIICKYKDKMSIKRGPQGQILKNQWGVPIQESTPTESGKCLNGKETMEELLSSAVDWAFNDLLIKAGEDEINFSKSYQLAEASQLSRKHQLAVFKHMVFLILDAAGVTADCTHVPHVLLNNNGKGGSLQVDPSIAYCTKGPDGIKDVVLYKNKDSWSPVDPSKFPRGIDPLAVKWILTRYEDSPEEMETLQKLILNPMLKEVFDTEGVNKDLLIANELIEEIALALMGRYHELFTGKLNRFATDRSLSLEGPEQKAQPVNWTGAQKPWISHDMRGTMLRSLGILTGLAQSGSKLLDESIDDKSRVTTLPSDSSKALQEIKKYFRVIHVDIREGLNMDHGCLFSSMAIALMQGASNKSEISPQKIRRAMAGFIEQNGSKWAPMIMERTRKHTPGKVTSTEGWTPQQYCAWLRGQNPMLKSTQAPRLRDDYNELELELFAHAFGIQVDVFVSGQMVRKDKKEFKSSYTYGPKTHEKIYLFNSQALSFYAITPRLTEKTASLDPSEKALVEHHQRYWVANCDDHLPDFDTGWGHFNVS